MVESYLGPSVVPLVLKSKTQPLTKPCQFDGHGNFVLRDLSHVEEILEFSAGATIYEEKWVPFDRVREIAVTVVRPGEDCRCSYL